MILSRKFVLGFTFAAFAIGFSIAASHAQIATNLKCKGCVGKKDLGKKAVGKKNIAKKAVVPKNLKAPTGAAVATRETVTDITSLQIVTDIVVKIPKAGVVVVNASGSFRFDTANASVACVISNDGTLSGSYFSAAGTNVTPYNRQVFGATQAFIETSGGIKTYSLVCNTSGGANIDASDPVMTAIYAPTNILVP